MLVISRKKNQKLIVAEDIEITILEIGRNRVRFGINAPKHIRIQTHLKGNEPELARTEPEPASPKVSAPGELTVA